MKLGGRLIVSDIVLLKELPAFIKDSITAYVGCVAGAMLKDDYLMVMEDVGFGEIEVLKETFFSVEGLVNDPMAKAAINKMAISEEDLRDVGNSVLSLLVRGIKTK